MGSWISAAALEGHEASTYLRLTAAACGIAPRDGSRELGTERRAYESKSFSDEQRKSSRVVLDAFFDGFASCHLCMLSWRAACGGGMNLIPFGVGWFRKSPGLDGVDTRRQIRDISVCINPEMRSIFSCGDPALFPPSHHNSPGKKLGPLPRQANPKGWVPTPRILSWSLLWRPGRLVIGN